MQLEKQCCNLESAKKLKELGITQKSLYYWKCNEIQEVVTERQMKEWIEKYAPNLNQYYSAFTVAELVQMLKSTSNIDYDAEFKQYNSISDIKEGESIYSHYSTFAEGCAAKLIRSIDHNWITVDLANKRLME